MMQTEPTDIRSRQAEETPVQIIQPARGLGRILWRELWDYRELVYFLAWRDIKVHYKQALLGVTWTVLQPLISIIIFSVIFGRLARLPSEGLPYPIFSLAGLLPWLLFSGALSRSSSSLVNNANMITKIYFPRLLIPLSSVISGVLDFLISLALLIVMMWWYGIPPSLHLVFLPLFFIAVLACALGVGLWFSALNVHFRDVQFTLPFLIQAWMFASPVAYSIELIPQGHGRLLYGLNPLAGIIQGFRWTLIGGTFPGTMLWTSAGMIILLLISGLLFFKWLEKTFADMV